MPDELRDAPVRVHRRQFVLGPHAIAAQDHPDIQPTVFGHWQFHSLGGRAVLSADPELACSSARDLDGQTWWLLGVAVRTKRDEHLPLSAIAGTPTRDLPGLMQSWSGRWILIGESTLHPDATAQLGCHYATDAAGHCWVSSSPTLIEQVLGTACRRLTWTPAAETTIAGISWFMPPASGLSRVSRLLPSQVLDWHTATAHARPLLSPPEAAVGDTEARCNEQDLIERLDHGIRCALADMAELNANQPLTLLLSGGRDSRILLSLAADEDLPLTTYTRIHRRASLADRRLPPKLARLCGYPWQAHVQRKALPGRRELIEAHAGMAVSRLSAEEFLHGGSDPLTGIALTGFCAELGRDRLLPEEVRQRRDAAGIAAHFGETHAEVRAAVSQWLAWREAYPETELDLDDCFFLEQRTAGRKGAKEQIADVFRMQRLSPLNSTRLLSLIARLDERTRRSGDWIERLISRGVPGLNDLPANPPDASFGWWRGKLLNPAAWHRLAARLRLSA